MSGSLTAFEKFMYWQDQPAYPSNCVIRLGFAGRFDREALMSAVRDVVPRHSLLTSAVKRGAFGPFWVGRPGALPDVEWLSSPAGGEFPAGRHRDLDRETGLRMQVVQDRDRCQLILEWHHSCSDGLGIQAFIDELLVAYAGRSDPGLKEDQLPATEESQLARRRFCGLTPRTFLQALPGQRYGLPGVLQFLLRSPAPLVSQTAPRADEPAPAGYPACCLHAFTREETAALRNVARRLGATVNDLLVRDVYLALGEWGKPAEKSWYRMMVPMNLRSAADRGMPAANCVSAVFLDRRRKDLADRSKLLSGISGEMQRIKDRKLGYIFIYSLWLVGLVPGAIRYKVRQDQCYSTCVFTNVGKLMADTSLPKRDGQCIVGGLVLEDIAFIAPIRPHTAVTFGATEYAGRLCMTVHYDSHVITRARADELTGIVARSVRETISSAT